MTFIHDYSQMSHPQKSFLELLYLKCPSLHSPPLPHSVILYSAVLAFTALTTHYLGYHCCCFACCLFCPHKNGGTTKGDTRLLHFLDVTSAGHTAGAQHQTKWK